MSDTTVEKSDDCGCDAKFADIASAIERQNERIQELTKAVNTVGEMVQSITDTVANFAAKFQGMNPMDMLKGVFGNGRK